MHSALPSSRSCCDVRRERLDGARPVALRPIPIGGEVEERTVREDDDRGVLVVLRDVGVTLSFPTASRTCPTRVRRSCASSVTWVRSPVKTMNSGCVGSAFHVGDRLVEQYTATSFLDSLRRRSALARGTSPRFSRRCRQAYDRRTSATGRGDESASQRVPCASRVGGTALASHPCTLACAADAGSPDRRMAVG